MKDKPHARPLGARRLGLCGWSAGWLLLLAATAQAFGQVSLLDSSFKVGPGANDAVDALVLQADQRILVGGEFTAIGGCSNSFLARLNPDGSVDTSFNPAGQTDGAVQCLVQQPDRRVLVGGAFGRLLGQARPALARLQEDGSGGCRVRRRVGLLLCLLSVQPNQRTDPRRRRAQARGRFQYRASTPFECRSSMG